MTNPGPAPPPDPPRLIREMLLGGGLGSSAEYLFRTRDGLRGLGVEDTLMERLATDVRALMGEPGGS